MLEETPNQSRWRAFHCHPVYAGVDSFLRSRGIIVVWGDPNDPPSRETVCGIGNRKNALFNEVLR